MDVRAMLHEELNHLWVSEERGIVERREPLVIVCAGVYPLLNDLLDLVPQKDLFVSAPLLA